MAFCLQIWQIWRMLSDDVHAQLLGMLGSGAWAPGARLPPEHELARRFGVSRPILRQALARLRTEGRVEPRKGSGTYVRAPTPAPSLTFGPLGSIPEVRDFLEFRCSLESEAAARAAKGADPPALARLAEAHARLGAALAAGAPGVEEDIAFHRTVAEASGNRFFALTLTALTEQMGFGIRLTRELTARPLQERAPALMHEHDRIHVAILAGDAEAARAAMQDHLASGIRRLFGS